MQTKPYTKRKIDNSERVNASIGKSIVVDSASSLYMQLKESCADDMTEEERYAILKQVFRRAVDQAVLDCQIAFVGLFAKVDYCIKEYDIPSNIANLIQLGRKDLFPRPNSDQELSAEELSKLFPHNLKATTLLVYHVCGKEEIPEQLKACFPRADRKKTWGRYSEKVLRVVVERWDDEYIWATEEENNNTLQISYGKSNRILTLEGKSDWSYLKTTLWEGARLNLVRIRMDERGEICLPELIILEPDYLINITTISSCFESYAESPFVNLVNKIKPNPNTLPIHLGNLSGQFLDDVVHDRNIAFSDSIKEFVSRNIISIISCPGMELPKDRIRFTQDAQIQKRNISHLIGVSLPQSIKDYNRKGVVLEPSFFSEVLGIQGRLDFLWQKDKDIIIIEQKSGKGDFVPYTSPSYNPNIPKVREPHWVQALLYGALLTYGYDKYPSEIRGIMLLYSKYSEGLVSSPNAPQLLHRAIRMRNLLAWSEILYAKEGLDILTSLTPDMLNKKKVTGRLWEDYIRPQLSELLSPIASASKLERLYYLRFLRFLENEQLLAKVGNKTKEDSGFASTWNDTLEDKKAAGNIYDKLHIAGYDFEDKQETSVSGIKLRFEEPQSADTTNFRIGDIVMLYPYNYNKDTKVPDACAQMVHRATIIDMRNDSIELRLRCSQTDKTAFENKPDDTLWAIEHDMLESMTGSLYSAMHSFLSAPKERRDLILLQRQPETDPTIRRKGEYGNFNTLVDRAKQARDLFLIIGPPGTGKTSYGLVNLLKEELLEEDTNVLLLSYTNRAVDEICSKLVELKGEDPDFDFVRIGSELSCSKEYRQYLLSNKLKFQDLDSGRKTIRSTRVFCGTTAALNANVSLLQIKHFSLAIVDESSQILEPHLIGLLSAQKDNLCRIDKFVLIGDHKQLPAVVQQSEKDSAIPTIHDSQKNGVVDMSLLQDICLTNCRNSLFERLIHWEDHEERTDFIGILRRQGRMHPEIAEFPNRMFYRREKLEPVPCPHQLEEELSYTLPSADALDDLLKEHRMIFLPSQFCKEPNVSDKINANEAKIVVDMLRRIHRFYGAQFDPQKTVGVIVPYRNQIAMVRKGIEKLGIPELEKISIDTVERYQGSQRDVIIYSFTIQNIWQLDFLAGNSFIEDGAIIDRKLNVAITRARKQMIMTGNPEILRNNQIFSELMKYVKEKGGYF